MPSISTLILDPFEAIEDKYIRERLIDIKQMIISLLELLQSGKKLNVFNKKNIENKIIITDEITPKDIIDIHHNKGLGVISSHGSRSSHSAILSKSLSLPMMVKVESSINIIKNGDKLIMDSDNQVIIINPDSIELKHFKKLQSDKKTITKSYRFPVQRSLATGSQ